MAKKEFMNKALGAHMDAAGLGEEPDPLAAPQEEGMQNQAVTCPKCGAQLSLEPAEESEAEHAALAAPAPIKGPVA
jgi:hypothetical protein